jgi:hypothetical protein
MPWPTCTRPSGRTDHIGEQVREPLMGLVTSLTQSKIERDLFRRTDN